MTSPNPYPVPTPETDTLPCYVCGTPVVLGDLETFADGSWDREELDEDRHATCRPCRQQAYQIADDTLDWHSSEDGDLRVLNAVYEALRQGRQALASPAEPPDDAAPPA